MHGSRAKKDFSGKMETEDEGRASELRWLKLSSNQDADFQVATTPPLGLNSDCWTQSRELGNRRSSRARNQPREIKIAKQAPAQSTSAKGFRGLPCNFNSIMFERQHHKSNAKPKPAEPPLQLTGPNLPTSKASSPQTQTLNPQFLEGDPRIRIASRATVPKTEAV